MSAAVRRVPMLRQMGHSVQGEVFVKFISNIPKAATSELVTEQNEAWKSLVCDGYNSATRVYLLAIEKELTKRIHCSALIPMIQALDLQSAISSWRKVSTPDDRRVVDAIANEILLYLPQKNKSVDVETITRDIALKVKHEIHIDDVEIALAKLVLKGKILRQNNRYS